MLQTWRCTGAELLAYKRIRRHKTRVWVRLRAFVIILNVWMSNSGARVEPSAWDACRQWLATSPGRPCQCEPLPATSVYCHYLYLCTPVNSDEHDGRNGVDQVSHSGAQPAASAAGARPDVCGDTWEAFTTSTVLYSYVDNLHNTTPTSTHTSYSHYSTKM